MAKRIPKKANQLYADRAKPQGERETTVDAEDETDERDTVDLAVLHGQSSSFSRSRGMASDDYGMGF